MAISVVAGTFIASAVEFTEMVIIVVGVGATRGWRSTIIGTLAGLAILVGIIAGLGQALQLIPISTVRIVIGALLLTFGLQWYRKGVIGVAADGFSGGGEEEADAEGAAGGAIDWTAFVLSFKGVLLEGLEVAFIVVAFGAGGGGGGGASGGFASGSYVSAFAGAIAAFIVIGGLGLAAKSRLEKVPGRTLKFGVGGLLSTFGTYWTMEGLGVHWPGAKLSLAWLYAVYLASTFALMYAVRAGWLGPRPASSVPDPGPAGPSGLAPASDESIRAFQTAHGLRADGIVGPRTQAAIRAIHSERGEEVDPYRLGVDPADPAAIADLQRRLDLPETGCVDALTRGALRLLQHPGFIDPLDAVAVGRFQAEHGLEPSGRVDEPTRVALRAVLADPRSPSPDSADGAQTPPDPLDCYRRLDPLDARSVARFQRSLGLRSSGSIDDETRGAMLALRAWRVVDPLDRNAVRDAQRRHELTGDGVIDGATRDAIAAERRRATESRRASGHTSEPDLLDADAVRRFQRRHHLADDGTVGPSTRAALRWERDERLSIDATSAESVRAFQARHGLRADGTIGPQTQAAMRAVRAERRRQADASRPDPGQHQDGDILDPADPEAVRRFQREHRLADDGRIGPRTRTALVSVRRERENRRAAGHENERKERK